MKQFVLLPTHITGLRNFFDAMSDVAEEAGLSTDMLNAIEVMLDNPPTYGAYMHNGNRWQNQTSQTTTTSSPLPLSVDDELAKLKAEMSEQ